MFWMIVIGSATVALVGLAVFLLVRRLRNLQLVSPILLDEVLDPDLRRLRHALLRRRGLSRGRRAEVGRRLIHIAARRAAGDGRRGPDEPEVEAAWRLLRDGRP